MTSRRLGIILVILSILIFGLISLPKFSFNIGERNVTFDYVDRALNKFNISLGNFKRSFGLYPTKEVKTSLQLSTKTDGSDIRKSQLDKYMKVIEKRLEISNLNDIKLSSEIKNEEYNLVFIYPDYYSDPLKYTQWLTAQGIITFQSASQESPSEIDLRDYNIQGPISVDYLDQVGSHLVYKFRSDDVTTLNSAFSANTQGRYFYMSIDNLPAFFVIEYDQYIDTNAESIRSLPTSIIEFKTVKEKNDYLNITRSYFQNEALEDSFTVNSDIKKIPAEYKSESLSLIGLSFIIAVFLISVAFLQKYGFRMFAIFTLMLLSFITIHTALLKVFSANLSISLLIGYVFCLILVISLIWYLITQNEEISKRDLVRIRDTSMFIFIITAIITRLTPSMGIYSDFIGVILICSLVMFILSIINFRILIDLLHSDFKIPKLNMRRK